MRTLVATLFLFGSGLFHAETGAGQLRAEPGNASQAQEVPFPGRPPVPLASATTGTAAMVQGGPSYGRVVIGTTLGAVVGGAAGLGMVAMIRGEPADGHMFPAGDLLAGAVLGSIPGMYLGARLSSGRQGNPWVTGAASVGGTALGILVGAAVGGLLAPGDTGKAPEILGVALGVAVPLGLTSLAEWRSAQ
jgi:hypothetical protein